MSEKKNENPEPTAVVGEKTAVTTADAQKARLADASEIAEVHNSNRDKHSGSAGGKGRTVEVYELDEDGNEKIVATRKAEKSKNSADDNHRHVTVDELLSIASKKDDGFARSLATQIQEAKTESQREELQKHADKYYGQSESSIKDTVPELSKAKLSETGQRLGIEAQSNPAIEPVANLRAYADGLPDGERKDELIKLSKDHEAFLVAQTPVVDTRNPNELISPETVEPMFQTAGKPLEGSITVDSQGAESSENLTNTPEGWQKVFQKISALSFDQQVQVIGAGLQSGIDYLQWEQRERTLGSLIGTVQGVGTVAENLAKIADFGAALILNDKEKAGKLGEEFGTSIGQTIVGGVQLFRVADKYLFDIGYTGDYAKPFKDIVTLGLKMNGEWVKLPPLEQERIKAKFISEMVADGAVGTAGAAAIKKAGKLTEVLDIVAEHSSKLAKSGERLAKTVSDTVEDVMAPEYAVAGGGKWKAVKAADEVLDMTVMERRLFPSKFDPRHRLTPIEAARENARIKKLPFDEKEWEKLKPKEKADRLVKDGYELLEDPEPLPPFDSTKVGEAFRGDKDIFSPFDENGRAKSYINADGDMVPANIDGIFDGRRVDIMEHLLGSSNKNAKACSPWTSVGTSGVVYKYADGSGMKIDIAGLRKAIANGEVTGVKFIEHKELLEQIENSSWSRMDKKMATRFVNKDGEFVIEGVVPGRFIELMGVGK